MPTSATPKDRTASSARTNSELLLLCNDDVVVGPQAVTELVKGLIARPEVGLVEVHQLPFENPKEYDPVTGETCWCSLASALTRAKLFSELGGLDAESFFLHGADVDYSWRLRLSGHECVYRPSARVIVDQRVDDSGALLASPKEARYAAEADLLLSQKYAEPSRLSEGSPGTASTGPRHSDKSPLTSGTARLRAVCPRRFPAAERVALFLDGSYAARRFA